MTLVADDDATALLESTGWSRVPDHADGDGSRLTAAFVSARR